MRVNSSARWWHGVTRTSRYNKSVSCCRSRVSRFSIRRRQNLRKPSFAAPPLFQSMQREVAQAFVNFLQSEAARVVLRKKGLDPA